MWTRAVRRAPTVARALRAGTAGIGTHDFFDPAMPFGGARGGGFGRDLGEASPNEYTPLRSVWLNLE